jgi:para-nitrobenzyl esterase
LTWLILAVACLGQASQLSGRVPTEVVSIAQGELRGLVEKDVEVFRGIPFAAPPVGERRWRNPEPPAPWEGVRDCFEFGPACPQRNVPLQQLIPVGAIKSFSEDCLNLNVYRPASLTNQKLPVLFWIHGGGFGEGANSMGVYNGSSLARKGAVVVVINYRLGPYGFFAHPLLTEEAGTSGNYGILDQIAALRWVQRNIAAFGGDPNCVTIFGESAGGASVACLLVSPLSKGLFQRAIMQSAPDFPNRHLHEVVFGKPAAETVGKQTLRKCGVAEDADLATLRKIPAETLLQHFPALQPFGNTMRLELLKLPVEPCVDGVVLPEDPGEALSGGRFHSVPLIVGSTRDEGALFTSVAFLPTRKEQYEALLRRDSGQFAERFLALYPATNEVQVIRKQIVHLVTDIVFGARSRFVARASAERVPNTYRYLFSRAPRIPALKQLGALHGLDVPYVFQADDPVFRWEEWDRKLSDHMQWYWINFAATGDPNGQGLPTWPKYNRETEETLELGDHIATIKRYRHDHHDAVDKLLGRE